MLFQFGILTGKKMAFAKRKVEFPTLTFKRIQGNMIAVYDIINLKYDISTTVALEFSNISKR